VTLVHAQSSDVDAPILTLQTPSTNNAIIPADVTLNGAVTDVGGSGIRDVRYLLRDLSSAEFISPQGVLESPRVLRTAEIELSNPSSGTWSIPVSLPQGDYRLYMRVRDFADNRSVWAVRTDFSVEDDNSVVDETPPTLTLLQPSTNNAIIPADLALNGTVTDVGGSGIRDVRYLLRDLSSGEFISLQGAVESPRVLRTADIELSNPSSGTWSIPVSLPLGDYRLYMRVRDFADNRSVWAVRTDFSVESDNPPGNSVFVPDASDILDPFAFYLQDGYDTVNVLRVDVATRTTAGLCTVVDDSGCTLDDVLADINGDDDFTVDIPVKVIAEDYPDDGLAINAGFRQRGASSRAAPQKSFRVRPTGDASLWRNEQRLQLNKHPYDQSRILNKLSFDLMATIPHLPSLRTQFVNLWIDDGDGPVDNGLYTHVEAVKKEYLINRGRDKDDNIYKANFFLFSPSDLAEMAVDANGEPLDEARFNSRLEIERGDDHRKVVEMLTAFTDPNQSIESVIDRYFNRNNILTWLTVNLLLGQQDATSQNYFLYNPLGTEKFYFLPWDYDGSFRVEPQLSEETDERDRIYWGYSRYNDNLFVTEYLQIPGIHDQLMAAAGEIRRDYLTDAAIRSLTNSYTPLVRPIIGSEPDISEIGGIRRPENMGVWDARVASLPGVVSSNFAVIQRSPNMPLPHFLKAPEINNNGIVLWWNPAFEVTGSSITYDVQVSSTPNFTSGNIAFEAFGIADAANRVEIALNENELASGVWYYRVFARTSDPLLYQIAKNRLSEGGQSYFGVRRFSVP